MRGLYQPKMMSLHRLIPTQSHSFPIGVVRLAILGSLAVFGCAPTDSTSADSQTDSNRTAYHPVALGTVSVAKPNQVQAQGRIQPERGLIRISALPGDRVEQINVRAGDPMFRNDELIVLQSQTLRTLELQTAKIRLDEANAMRDAKLQEADLGIDSAKLKLEAATEALRQAQEQQTVAKKSSEQLASLRQQITTLQNLRDAPLTKAAIGSVELETKKNELQKASMLGEQTLLLAEQAVHLAQLQVNQGKKLVVAAEKSRSLVEPATPIKSLEKQIELLQYQVEQSKILAPFDGVIVSVNAEVGERTAQLPLLEVADLKTMFCVAEVHESDAGRVAVDDVAEMRSSALSGKIITGRVKRIDRVVGAAQMRSPNPMARSDFRSIPVWIMIDKEHTATAAERLQLQVDVSITTTR